MAQTYGLQTVTGNPVPLKKVDVLVDIQGFIANTTYTLTYKNEENIPIEAKFVFPMDDNSAIYHFEAEIDGRTIVAECMDKTLARETYEDAVEAGQTAFMLAESDVSRDIFECDVGNLPPQSAAQVRMRYATELDLQADGTVVYVFPATIFDRFSIGVNPDPQAKKPRLHRTGDGHVPYELSLEATLTSDRLDKVLMDGSPSNLKISYTEENGRKIAKVKPANQLAWNQDITLQIFYHNPYHPHVVAEKGKQQAEGILQEDVVVLNFFPSLKDDLTTNGEFFFVLDRSGSMSSNNNITHATTALLECLKILPPDSKFNVVSFGSVHDFLFPGAARSVQATQSNVKSASQRVRTMQADMGGTEILQPLQDILSQPPLQGSPRQVFLITDGGVYDTQAVIELVKKNSSHTRFFTFGIGHGVSTSLVKGVARAGRGKYQILRDATSLPQKVAQTMRCSQQANVDDVKVTWSPKVDARYFPDVLPPIFHGDRFIAYVMLKNATKETYSVTLSGKVRGRIFRHTLKFKLDKSSETAPVHRLAAKAAIKQLEEEENNDNKNEIVVLSMAANVISKFTAFIGVDHSGARMQDRPASRSIPVPSPQPVHYGGGSAASASAEFYLSGKVFNEPSVEPCAELKKMCPSMPTSGGCKTNACTTLEDDSFMPSDQQNKDEENTRAISPAPEQTPCPERECSMFARWRKSAYYPVTSIATSSYNRYDVIFQDGCKTRVCEDAIVSSAVLSVGDLIGVRSDNADNDDNDDTYMTGVLLEYHKDFDNFVVALYSGKVIWCQSADLMLPAKTAALCKTRRQASLKPTRFCEFLNGNDRVVITTSDMAELRCDGWITNNIVNFYIRHLENFIFSEEDKLVSHIFPPEFSNQLFSGQDMLYLRTRKSDDSLYDSVWPWLRAVRLQEKHILFIPVFDKVHWYLIVTYINENKQGLKISFEIMDSYYVYDEQPQIAKLASVLRKLCQEQGYEVEVAQRAIQRETPVQHNEDECGVMMLQALKQCFKDNLNPQPTADWFDGSAGTRQEISAALMELHKEQHGRPHQTMRCYTENTVEI